MKRILLLAAFVVLFQIFKDVESVKSCFSGGLDISNPGEASPPSGIRITDCKNGTDDLCVRIYAKNTKGTYAWLFGCASNSSVQCGSFNSSDCRSTGSSYVNCCYTSNCNILERLKSGISNGASNLVNPNTIIHTSYILLYIVFLLTF